MHKVVRFEIHVKDPQRAIEFYSKTFGWEFTKYEGEQEYWFINTGRGDAPGIDGGMMVSRDGEIRTINTIEVPSVDDYLQKLQEQGGVVALPKMSLPGIGYLGYGIDPEGRIFGLAQYDPTA